jgi:hypothetical protein
MCSVGFLLKRIASLNQFLPKIAKISRLVISANRRSGIRPGPGDGYGIHQRSTDCPAKRTDCPAKRSVLIHRAVLAAGRRRPNAARERSQAFRALALRGSAPERARPGVACSGAARGPRPQFLCPRPGIAWGRLFHVSTPARAVSSARAVRYAPSESVPRGTQAVSLKLAARHFRVST